MLLKRRAYIDESDVEGEDTTLHTSQPIKNISIFSTESRKARTRTLMDMSLTKSDHDRHDLFDSPLSVTNIILA